MKVKPFTQVRLKRAQWDTKHKTQALGGALLQVESFDRGVYTLFALTLGGTRGLRRMRFRCRRGSFSIMRQRTYCDLLEVEFPEKAKIV
jgi:hypothetical protein